MNRTERRLEWLVVVATLWLGACQHTAEPGDLERRPQSVVFGADDRREVYEHPDESLRALARESVAALIPDWLLDETDPDDIRVGGLTLGALLNYCEGEPFLSQPAASSCSGTLVGDDLILTAGHCVDVDGECEGYRIVFNYLYDTPGELGPITADHVYQCGQRLVWRADTLDYALLRLDRPVYGALSPAPVERDASARTTAESLVVIGFPEGIPAKIDSGGEVLDPRTDTLDYFGADLDTFLGSSGSGVFDAEGEVIGVVARGPFDSYWDGDAGCYRISRLSEEAGQIDVVYVQHALDAFCALAGEGEHALCQSMPADGGVPDAGSDAAEDSDAAADLPVDEGLDDSGVPDDADAGADDPATSEDIDAPADDLGAPDDPEPAPDETGVPDHSDPQPEDVGAPDDPDAQTPGPDVISASDPDAFPPLAIGEADSGCGCATSTRPTRACRSCLALLLLLALYWVAWLRDPSLPGGCPIVAAIVELDDKPGAPRDFLVAAQSDLLARGGTPRDRGEGL